MGRRRLDPFTNLIPQCVDMITLWCHLARHAVILGRCMTRRCGLRTGGGQRRQRHRSNNFGGVYWTVLER